MGPGDVDGLGAGCLIASSPARGRDTNDFGRNRALARSVGEFGLNNSLNIVYTDQHIFRLQVGVDHATTAMHIVEAKENLFSNLLDEVHRHALVLMPSNKAKQVFAQHLENHTNVRAVRATMPEMVKEADDMSPSRMIVV